MGIEFPKEEYGSMRYAAKTVTSADKKTIEVSDEIHDTLMTALNHRVHECLAKGGKAEPMSTDRLHWITQHMAAVRALDAVRRSA